jgi:hypothetical protein
MAEKPVDGGLLQFSGRFPAFPSFRAFGVKSPKVSGGSLKYSRFRETATGDWTRSTLGDRA